MDMRSIIKRCFSWQFKAREIYGFKKVGWPKWCFDEVSRPQKIYDALIIRISRRFIVETFYDLVMHDKSCWYNFEITFYVNLILILGCTVLQQYATIKSLMCLLSRLVHLKNSFWQYKVCEPFCSYETIP